MRKRNRDCTRSGTHVQDSRVDLAIDAREQCFHQVLSFGTGNEDIGRHLEEQAVKFLRANDVLHRFGRQAPGEEALVLGQFGLGERALRISEQGRLAASQHVSKKHFGVAPRIF